MSAITSFPKEKIQILLLENIADKAVQGFVDAGYAQVTKLSGALDEDQLIAAIKDVHLLGIRSKTQITAKVLAHANKLLAVGCYCIGINQVDIQYATEKGIVVFNSPYPNTRSVAELVIAEAIMLLRRVPEKNAALHTGIWMKDAKNCFELRGKTLGIIGYGNIGMQVSVLAEALGMKVIYTDVINKLPMGNARQVHQLTDLLQQSDVVSLHVPEAPSTIQLLNAAALHLMKKGGVLINCARGNVIDLDALQQLITSGHIGGAAIDVFPEEPEKTGAGFSSGLQNLPNVLLTPHIGGSTEEAQINISEDVTAKLIQYLEMGVSSGSHSVPALHLPQHPDAHRILHIHFNTPGVLSEINAVLSAGDVNIVGQYLNTNNKIGYAVIDVSKNLQTQTIEALRNVKHTIKMRVVY